MGIPESQFVWKNGGFVAWKDATVHLLSHVVQFGTSVFEGIRCYETPKGPAIFRLPEHLSRLRDSCVIYDMVPEYSADDLTEACRALVRKNSHGACYVRPMVLRGYGTMTLDPTESPIETWVASWTWGANPISSEAAEKGVNAGVSSWHRAMPNTFPNVAKAGGNYLNAQLIKRDAVRGGYAESIALGPGGLVSEGSGQNLFLVKDGVLITPILDGTSLAGITRNSVMRIATDMGVRVKEQPVPREMLYVADEIFFCGTATEILAVRSVDKVAVGSGKAGPITLELRKRFMDIVTGKNGDPYGWLTYVENS